MLLARNVYNGGSGGEEGAAMISSEHDVVFGADGITRNKLIQKTRWYRTVGRTACKEIEKVMLLPCVDSL